MMDTSPTRASASRARSASRAGPRPRWRRCGPAPGRIATASRAGRTRCRRRRRCPRRSSSRRDSRPPGSGATAGWRRTSASSRASTPTCGRCPARAPSASRRRRPSSASVVGTDEDLTMAATEFLRAFGHQRFFLYLHYMDVHQYAYDEASGQVRDHATRTSTTTASTGWTATSARCWAPSQDRDLQRKTVIVVAADHGEGFREHGLEGHARTLYREVAEVPFILSLPFELSPGIVVPQTVANIDIWPTILDLFGLPALAGCGRQVADPADRSGGEGRDDPLRSPRLRRDRPHLGSPVGRSGSARLGHPGSLPGDATAHARQGRGRRVLRPHARIPGKPRIWRRRRTAGAARFRPSSPRRSTSISHEPPVAWGKPKEVELNEMELNQLNALGYVIK